MVEQLTGLRALSLTQPWATAMAIGIKGYETRSWSTGYRGPLAIHASKGFPGWAKDFAIDERYLGRLPDELPLGAIVALVDLVRVYPTDYVRSQISDLELDYGDYSPGRFAWKLDNVRVLSEPVACKGSLGLWRPSEDVIEGIREQLTQLDSH